MAQTCTQYASEIFSNSIRMLGRLKNLFTLELQWAIFKGWPKLIICHNHDLWEPDLWEPSLKTNCSKFCENSSPWKLLNQNFYSSCKKVRTTQHWPDTRFQVKIQNINKVDPVKISNKWICIEKFQQIIVITDMDIIECKLFFQQIWICWLLNFKLITNMHKDYPHSKSS